MADQLSVGNMTRLNLYGTSACHLCEEAESLLLSLQASGNSFQLHKIDIADDDHLMDLYGVRIPVISIEGSDSDLGWPFTEDEVLNYLRREGPP